ncbi:MAG: hypothetical protein Q4A16_09795, partial [Lautropia sp.]|nr:hypothetical protein [Lautropia sp.]
MINILFCCFHQVTFLTGNPSSMAVKFEFIWAIGNSVRIRATRRTTFDVSPYGLKHGKHPPTPT